MKTGDDRSHGHKGWLKGRGRKKEQVLKQRTVKKKPKKQGSHKLAFLSTASHVFQLPLLQIDLYKVSLTMNWNNTLTQHEIMYNEFWHRCSQAFLELRRHIQKEKWKLMCASTDCRLQKRKSLKSVLKTSLKSKLAYKDCCESVNAHAYECALMHTFV